MSRQHRMTREAFEAFVRGDRGGGRRGGTGATPDRGPSAVRPRALHLSRRQLSRLEVCRAAGRAGDPGSHLRAGARLMKSRANVRCPACHWSTSRAPRADHDYGRCACGAVVSEPPRRPLLGRPGPTAVTFSAWYADTYGEGFTWPELVAMELEKQERAERAG